jgi:hypothetical protein
MLEPREPSAEGCWMLQHPEPMADKPLTQVNLRESEVGTHKDIYFEAVPINQVLI